MNTGRQASQRATLHVDVGPELSARVRAAAAAGAAYFFWRKGVLGTIVTGMLVYLPLHIGLGW